MTSFIAFLTLFTLNSAISAHEDPIVFLNPPENANLDFIQEAKLTRRLLNLYPGEIMPLSQEAKQTLLDAHNECRQETANGNTDGQPGATNMNNLVWDETLASTAESFASMCLFAQNPNTFAYYETEVENTTEWIIGALGENVYYTSQNTIPEDEVVDTLKSVVETWYNQSEYYYPGEDNECVVEDGITLTTNCRFFKQLVNAKTRYVGCGYAQCNQLTFLNHENFNDGANVVVCYYYEDNNNEDPYIVANDIATASTGDDCDSDTIEYSGGLCLGCYPNTNCEDGLGRSVFETTTQNPTQAPSPAPTPEPTTSVTRSCGDWIDDVRFAPRNILEEITGVRREQACCNRCLDNDDCAGVSYISDSNICTLYSATGREQEMIGARSSRIMIS